ncbi:MAG: gliding motility-associated-like protein, partial [Luteibaculaceae bacterium]
NDVSEVQFNPGNGAPRLNGLQFPFSYPEAGNYIPEINFMSSNGCAQHQILDTILVHPIPNGEIMVSPNALNIVFSKAELLLSADVELASAEWLAISEGDTLFPGSDPNVEVTFPADVRVWEISNVFTSVFGCVNSTEKVIKIHPNSTIYAPSGFTPDGDYINDVFKISYSGVELQGFEVHIYDRWGIIVFSSKDPNFEWDGRIKGEQRKMDTYAWVIKYFEQEDIRKSLSGKITLLR